MIRTCDLKFTRTFRSDDNISFVLRASRIRRSTLLYGCLVANNRVLLNILRVIYLTP